MTKHGQKCTLIVPVRNEAKNLVQRTIPSYCTRFTRRICRQDLSEFDDKDLLCYLIPRAYK